MTKKNPLISSPVTTATDKNQLSFESLEDEIKKIKQTIKDYGILLNELSSELTKKIKDQDTKNTINLNNSILNVENRITQQEVDIKNTENILSINGITSLTNISVDLTDIDNIKYNVEFLNKKIDTRTLMLLSMSTMKDYELQNLGTCYLDPFKSSLLNQMSNFTYQYMPRGIDLVVSDYNEQMLLDNILNIKP